MSMQCPFGNRAGEINSPGQCTFNAGHAGPHSYEIQAATREATVTYGEADLGGWNNGAAIINGEWRVTLPEGAQGRLMAWWLNTSLCDFNAGAPKVEEYGAHDLEIMGALLMLLVYKERMQMLHEAQQSPVGTELACWFYVLGKVARLVSDYLAERPGKDDTWHDITFYSMMARRIQETGAWPG